MKELNKSRTRDLKNDLSHPMIIALLQFSCFQVTSFSASPAASAFRFLTYFFGAVCFRPTLDEALVAGTVKTGVVEIAGLKIG